MSRPFVPWGMKIQLPAAEGTGRLGLAAADLAAPQSQLTQGRARRGESRIVRALWRACATMRPWLGWEIDC